jgi:hypothetical protein
VYIELDGIRTFQLRINKVTEILVIISKYTVCAPIKPCCYQSHPRKCVENYSFDFAGATCTTTTTAAAATTTSNTNTRAAAANATDSVTNITTSTKNN